MLYTLDDKILYIHDTRKVVGQRLKGLGRGGIEYINFQTLIGHKKLNHVYKRKTIIK
jgi:hypothetical protein